MTDAVSPQEEFEESMLIRGRPGPFDVCMDMAATIAAVDAMKNPPATTSMGRVGEQIRLRDVSIGLDIIVVIALACYQAGVEQHDAMDSAARLGMDIYDVELDGAIEILTDPIRAWPLLDLRPGWSAIPDGRVRRFWLDHVPYLQDAAQGLEWDWLRQRAGDVLARTRTTYVTRLRHLLTEATTLGTQGWHVSPGFPALPGVSDA